MKLILVILFTALYVLMAIRFFKSWWIFFKRDTNLTSGWTYVSIAVLILASIFWVIVVPFAYLELLEKVQQSAKISTSEIPEVETTELDNTEEAVSPVEQ